MGKLSKFDETKVKLVMKLRKLTRQEAVKALGLRAEKRSGGTHPEGASDRALSAKEFFSKVDDGMELMSAEEFFGK